MKKSERYQHIITYFEQAMPVVDTELNYETPFQLLVAVVLSAQCTDKRVNIVTPTLFNKYPTAKEMSKASQEEIFELIRSISYPNSKAKHLRETAKILVEEYNEVIPSDLNKLQTLPGVGRKTANVLGVVLFDLPVMPVDTHVFRVANRIGLAKGKTPLSVEKQLVKGFPNELLPKAHHWLILHGRYKCTAQKPECSSCNINTYCQYYKKNNKSVD